MLDKFLSVDNNTFDYTMACIKSDTDKGVVLPVKSKTPFFILQKGYFPEMKDDINRTIAFFYCQNVPESGEDTRQTLEKRYGRSIRLFPMPCSGRIDSVHLLRALEEFADAVYVITCPLGACRYLEGNKRVKKRIEKTKTIIEGIGLEKERLNLIAPSGEERITLTSVAEDIMKKATDMAPSPVFQKMSQDTGRKAQGR
jgi:F420-non-reducing hydrogenase iron-sulfur subunit